MSAPTLTDAAVTRMIRRVLIAPRLSSDGLLILADGLAEAAFWTDDMAAAAMLTGHVQNLRTLAPYFAEPDPLASGTPNPLEAARIVVRHHGLTTSDLNTALSLNPRLDAVVGALFDAAESIEENLQ